MLVLPKKAAPAHKGPQPTPKPMAQQFSFPAPTQGWVLNENLATPSPAGARILDNWWCTPTGIKVRGGTTLHATLGAAVVSMFSYKSGADEKFFVATAADIFDITSPADPEVTPTATVTDQSGGYYVIEQFATAGGEYLYALNGSDYPLLYDGTEFNPVAAVATNEVPYSTLTAAFSVGETVTGGTSGASATILAIMPTSATAGTLKLGAITAGPFQNGEALTSAGGAATASGASAVASTIAITGVTTTGLSFVWSYANRLFFVESGTMNAWYLPVDSIGGAANSFSLGGVFKKGGALLFGATWSMDAGDGLDDKCVFISTEGEVAIYSGTNPGSATDWAKQGVYQITRPLGPKAIMQAGGDLLIATETGLVPLSEAIRRDVAALSLGAVSRKIESHWQARALSYSASNWEVIKWPQKNLMLVSQPGGGNTCLAANLQTGAWSRVTGWDTNCLGFFGGDCYYGDSTGLVFQMESGGSDNGAIYTASWLGQHDPMSAPGLQKTVHQMRALFTAGSPINAQLFANINFDESLNAPPSAVTLVATAGWDVSLWDVGLWDEATGGSVSAGDARWTAVGVTGHTIAPQLQLTFGSAAAPNVSLVTIDATYTVGALVA